jgi:hypothetical protein
MKFNLKKALDFESLVAVEAPSRYNTQYFDPRSAINSSYGRLLHRHTDPKIIKK